MSSFTITLLFASALLALGQQDGAVCTDVSECATDAGSLLVTKSSVTRTGSEQHSMAQIQQHSLDLSQHLATVAKSKPQGSSTQGLLASYKICGQCKSFERFGEANDGGYLMCMDGLKKGSVGAAYSLGVEHHDQWSEDVLKKLGAPVNQFDCTVHHSDCKGCKFFKKCIVAADGKHPVPGHETEGWSLKEALVQTKQADAADGSLLMKMDIEASEWAIFASEPPEALKKIGELIVEFHNLQDVSLHKEYLQAMEHILAAGFKVAHLHGNNYQGMYQTGADTIPQVLEVTFVHGAARSDGCMADQVYQQKLDAPNNPTANELPMAHVA